MPTTLAKGGLANSELFNREYSHFAILEISRITPEFGLRFVSHNTLKKFAPSLLAIAALCFWGCTKSPQANKRSTYNCDTNPAECNGGVDPTSSGANLDFTVPETVTTNTDFEISWGAVQGASTYDLIIGKDENCNDIALALRDQTVTKQRITMTTTGTYYACLEAKNSAQVVLARKFGKKFVVSAGGELGFTAASNLRIGADSATATSHSSTDDDKTIYFIWDAATDGANGIKSYTVKYYNGANCNGTLAEFTSVTTTSKEFSNATFTATYSFLVEAENGKGETKKSDCSSSVTINYPVFQMSFDNASDYTFNTSYLGVSGGVAALLAVVQVYDENNSAEFGQTKAHNNTVWDTDHLELKNAGAPDPRPLPNDFYSGIDGTSLKFIAHLDAPNVYNGDVSYSDAGVNGTFNNGGPGSGVGIGKQGRAGGFDSFDQYFDYGDTTVLELTMPFSVVAWFDMDVLPSTDEPFTLISKYNSSSSQREWYFCIYNDDKLSFWKSADGFSGGTSEIVQSDYTLVAGDLNKWNRVSFTVDASGNWNMYMNGSSIGNGTFTSTTIHKGTAKAHIGAVERSTLAPDNLFDGTIDEVAVWGRELSAAEISTSYQSQLRDFAHEKWIEAPQIMDGNILLLHMDEASGNLIDYSGFSHNGTANGDPTYSQTGKVESAIDFDGTGDHFSFGNVAKVTGSNLTVSAWVSVDSFSSYDAIISRSRTGGAPWGGYQLNVDGDSTPEFAFAANISGTWQNVITTGGHATGTWYHVVGTYDGSNLRIYVNGILNNTTGSVGSIQDVATNLTVGRNHGNTQDIDGKIDEVAVWNRTLSPQEIQTIYNLQSGTYRGNVHELPNDQSQTIDDWFPMNGNVLLMHMNESSVVDSGTNPPVYDYSSSGLNGTFTAADDTLEKSINGQLGKALTFDGTNDHIVVTDTTGSAIDFANGTTITIAAWINPTSLNDLNEIVAKSYTTGANNVNYGLRAGNGSGKSKRLTFYYESSTSFHIFESSADVIQTGKWNHVVATYTFGTGSSAKLYHNGRNISGAWESGSGNSAPTVDDNPLWIGAVDSATAGSLNELFTGSIDELAIWNRALSADEISKIYDYQSGKYSGTFISNVMDTGSTSASWTTLAWNMIRPYGKPLGANSDLSSNYSSLPNNTLMNDNLVLLNLNETSANSATGGNDFEDSSSNGHHATEVNTLGYGVSGKFHYGVSITPDNYISVANHTDFNVTEGTFSVWFKTDGQFAGGSSARSAIVVRQSSNCSSDGASMGLTTAGIAYLQTKTSGCGGSKAYATSTPTYLDNKWHHMLLVFRQGVNELNTLYVDGVKVAEDDNDGAWSFGAHPILIGWAQDFNANHEYRGLVDEFAMWGRALSLAEIQEVYRRGASRIRYKVRSCDSSGCDDEPWIVPNSSMTPYSSYGEFFSELHNTTTSSPSLTFGGFGSHTVSNNRFFQWQAYLDTTDTNEIPELKSVTVGPAHYYGGDPTIVNSNSLAFSSLKSFTETSSAGTIKYQLSNDGGTTWYWYNSGWTTTTTGYSESSSATDINTNIATFPVGSGSLRVKAFLNSAAAAQATSLENVSVQYEP